MTGVYEGAIRRLELIAGEGKVLVNEPMKNHTSFKTGGNALALVVPESADTLLSIIELLREECVPFYIMGNGTNLLVRDNGYKGVIIKLCGNYSEVKVNNSVLTAEAGALLSAVSKIAYENSLSGLEFAEGIPGTIGGAAAMNAGAYGGEMKEVILSASVMDASGNIFTLDADALELGYRKSAISERGLVCLSVDLGLREGEKSLIKANMDENKRLRIEKQPLDKFSAGSTFKRPKGYFAGKLISDSGLKGFRIGGAAVSEKHAGFIINDGNASASEIVGLIEHVQRKVFEKHGVRLEPEVRIIGELA